MSFSLRNTVKRLANDVNPFDAPQPASTARPQVGQPTQFGPVAQQRLIARNPTTAPGIIAHGPNMPSTAPTPRFNPIAALPGAFKQGAQQVGLATGLGAVRTGTGIAQGLSGLTDLVTPGTGTSRVSKSLNHLAVNTDQTAKANNVNAAYKIAQVPLNAATFLVPGGAATKVVSSIPKVGDALNAVAHVAEPVTNILDRGVGTLATKGAAGRIAAAGVHGALQPTNFLNAGGATAMQVGTESGKGQRITPASTAASFGANLALGGALHAAPQAAVEAGHGLHVAGKAVNAATKEATGQTFAGLPKKQVIMDTQKLDLLHNAKQDLVTAHANPALANDVNHGLRDLQQTHGLDFVTGSRGERLARIQQYLEQNGEAIPKLQAHQEKVAAVKNFAVDHPLGMTSGAVNDAGERIGMNGKPLKTTVAPAPSTKLVPLQPRAAAPAPRPAAKDTGAVSSVKPSTPIDVNQYVKNLSKAQDSARKAGTPTGLAKVKSGSSQIKSKLVDSFAPIEDKLNQKITADNATSHITPQIDRALRADTIAGQYIKDKGLAKVIQSVPNTKEFDQYLIAKHAADLEKNGVKTGRSSEADKQLVAALKDKYEPHAKAIQQYSQGLLDKAVEYGLVSKQLASNLKEKYPNYVPANRIFGDNELVKPPKGVGGGKASLGSQSVVQRIKGSSRQIESPLDSLIHKTQDVIDQGERNRAAQILTGYKELPGNPFELRELGPSENVGAKHVISVLNDGKTRRFETSKEVADAAKSLSKEQLGLIGKILAVPTRVLRLGATSLNPAFTGANVVKDLASGAINSKNPLRSSVANPRVFVKALAVALNHNSKSYAELVREGAGGTSYDIARNAPKQNVRSIRMDRNAGTRALYTVTSPSQLLRAAENTIGRSEEFSRALQYYGGKSAALAKGANEESARVLGAHAARNNTVNFARAGDYGRVLNSVLPYLNAGIQGSRTLIRTAAERPLQTATKLAIIGFMPTAATTAWNIATPDRRAAYDDIKDYEKQGNIIIVPPNPKKDANGRWNVIKIPVSQEVANLNNIVRNGVETGLKDGTFNAKQLVGDLIGTTTSLNAQNGRQLIGQVTPQAVKPVLEGVVNQNLFTGNKIIPDSQKNLDARDQYGDNTSGTAKVLGRNLNIAPRQIDNAIRTGTGGLGQNIVNASDNALAKAGKIKPNEVKGTSVAIAVQKRFNGAQGSSKYDVIDQQSADLTKQLKALPGYQSMNPADKAKALNRLTNAITGTYTTNKALSVKQQAINNGSVKVSDYLTPSTGGNATPIAPKLDTSNKQFLTKYNAMSATDRTKAATTQNDFEYKAKAAQYANDKANNKLTRAQDISAQQSVAKAKVGSSFSKDTRDLYGLSKPEVYSLITSDPNGKQIANDLLKYGDALQAAGVATNKFRTSKGATAFQPKQAGSSSSTSSKKNISSFISMSQAGRKAASNNQNALLNLIRGAKIAGKSQPRVKVANVTLKKQRTNKKAKVIA